MNNSELAKIILRASVFIGIFVGIMTFWEIEARNPGPPETLTVTPAPTPTKFPKVEQPTATPVLPEYALLVHYNDEDGGIIQGADQPLYPKGEELMLSALPNPGWEFTGWEGACSGQGLCLVEMNDNKLVIVNFAKIVVPTNTPPPPTPTFTPIPTPTNTPTPTTPPPPTSPPTPEPPRTISLQGESGTGGDEIMPRGNASRQLTKWLRLNRSLTLSFTVSSSASYHVIVRYSNDNSGRRESVRVEIDGDSVDSFTARDTGDWGRGWDVFAESDPLGPINLSPGSHSLEIDVSGGDGNGIEIDEVRLEPIL